jgi:DNA-binding MarR family transcriptional regulator
VNAEAARRLAEELVQGDGIHQLGTLSPAKIRVLAAVHDLDRPCSTDQDLAEILDWTRQYVYRLANELAEQGVLVRSPGPPAQRNGRRPTLYQCICFSTKEGPQK